MAAALSMRDGRIQVGELQPLFKLPPFAGNRRYDVSADGQRFLVGALDTRQPFGTLSLVLNWSDALRAQQP